MTILNFDVVWGLKGKSLWREICAKDCVPFESEMMVKGGGGGEGEGERDKP